jgi:hypothetical protein
MGLLAQSLNNNGIGYVVTEGLLDGLNTSTATVADPVWLGVDGALIYGLANKPTAPANLVYLGVVTRVNSNNGEIFVKVQNGYELDELHDVAAQSPSNGQTLVFNSTNSLWESNTVSLSAGVNGTLPVANGGTGQTTYTNGQLLIGNNTGNTLTKATLTAGTGISITNGTGSITIAATGPSLAQVIALAAAL